MKSLKKKESLLNLLQKMSTKKMILLTSLLVVWNQKHETETRRLSITSVSV